MISNIQKKKTTTTKNKNINYKKKNEVLFWSIKNNDIKHFQVSSTQSSRFEVVFFLYVWNVISISKISLEISHITHENECIINYYYHH
jgi:hypothetical protein